MQDAVQNNGDAIQEKQTGYDSWDVLVTQHKAELEGDAMVALFFSQFVENVDFEGVMEVLSNNPQLYFNDESLFDAMVAYFENQEEEQLQNVNVKRYLATKIIEISDEMPEYLEPMLALRDETEPEAGDFLLRQEFPSFAPKEYMGEGEPQAVQPLDAYLPQDTE